jgi:leucyl-tRNA synthetase
LVVDEDDGQVVVVDDPPDSETLRVLHRTIDAVRRDYESLSFNTAIARLTELVNALTKLDRAPREAAEPLVLMVAPLAPHIAEELWSRLGHRETLSYEPFPTADPALLAAETVTCVVQINGKVRDRIQVSIDITADSLRDQVLSLPKVVIATTAGVSRVIVRAPRLVNVVPS